MQMTKALAVEWAQYGINVNAVAPGFFETAMTKVLLRIPPQGKRCSGTYP